MHKPNYIVKPRPSKLLMYENFYKDIEILKKQNYFDFSITDFACGESKLIDVVNPSYYQGIDLKKKLIETSKKKYKKNNFNFFIGNIINVDLKIKTKLGICLQTLGININFDENHLLKTLNNLNNHILRNGSIIFNLSSETYENNKKKIDEFCNYNYTKIKIIHYGLFNERYHYKLTRALIFLERLIYFKLKIKKFVYIKCLYKKF